METVTFNEYFNNKSIDDNFVNFFRYDSIKPNNDDVVYLLSSSKSYDERIDELYTVGVDIRTLVKTFKLKKNKKRSMRLTHNKHIFDLLDKQLLTFNRIIERDTNWALYPLLVLAEQLVKVTFYICDVLKVESDLVERCGRSIHRSFNLCLNDRNPVITENRKTGVYMFANLEFKIYHKLNNRDMIKNLIKVIKSRQDDVYDPIPTCEDSLASLYKSHIVLYNYYMGEYYGCFENDFALGFDYIYKALTTCNQACYTQIERILVLLIPFGILSRRIYPNPSSVLNMLMLDGDNSQRSNNRIAIEEVYTKIINCLEDGNISEYDNIIGNELNEIFFLKNGIYVAIQLIRELVLMKLVKICFEMNESKSILPFDIILLGYDLNRTASHTSSNDLECQLANLINKSYIKGYLSHGNKCMVVSKKEAFPKLVLQIDDSNI